MLDDNNRNWWEALLLLVTAVIERMETSVSSARP